MAHINQRAWKVYPWAGLTAAGVLWTLSGCASTPPAAGAGNAEQQAELEAAAARLNQMLARSKGIELGGGGSGDESPNRQVFPAPPDFGAAEPPAAATGAESATATNEVKTEVAAQPPAPPPLSEAQREERALTELIDLLSRRAAGADAPLVEAFKLAAIGVLQPGAGAPQLREIEACLNPDQRARLEAFRDLLSAFAATEGTDDLAARLRHHAATMTPVVGLTIPTALLAQRVDGFGKYVPFATNSFLAGQSQAVLVYVEVKDFAHKEVTAAPEAVAIDDPEPTGGETSWAVELTQELRLYHESDGVLAWHAREQASRDISKRKRTDHYLVQRIMLPATLTVGGYTLKVVVRDTNSSAVVERVLPIRIVADPALTHAAVR